jgi:hypothetical protein
MKKVEIILLAMVFTSFLFIGCPDSCRAQSDPFIGDWFIKDAKQGGGHYEPDVGCAVTIMTKGQYYETQGLDDRADLMSFTRRGNSLQGSYTADMKYLVKHYSKTFSENTLSQATGKVRYNCSIVSDGRGLVCRCDNASITAHKMTGVYLGSEPVKGYYEYYLER